MITPKKHDLSIRSTLVPLLLIAVVVYAFMRWWSFSYLGASLEGWFPYYSSLVKSGLVPYRDFYLFTTPLSVYIGALITSVFPDTLEVYRLFGIFERILLAAVLYLWMRRYFTSFAAFVGATCGVIIFSLHFMDTVYYYTIEAILFAVVCCWLLAIAAESTGRRQVVFGVLAGVFATCCFLTKHTTGIGLCGALVFALAYYQYAGGRSLPLLCYGLMGASIPGLIAVGYFLKTSSLYAFLSAMANGSSSKGSLSSILMRPFSNYFESSQIIFSTAILILAVVLFMTLRRQDSGLNHESSALHKNSNQNLILLFFSISAVTAVILATATSTRLPSRTAYNGFSDFALIAGLWIAISQSSQHRKSPQLTGLFTICVFGLMQVYVYNWSAGKSREPWGLLPLVPLAIAWLADYQAIWGKRFKMFAVGGLGLWLVIIAVSLRKDMIYSWESWREKDQLQDVVPFDSFLPHLRGIRASPTVTRGISELVASAQLGRQPKDTLYTFPFFPILNWITDRPTGAYAPVPYFDVCPDSVAKQDAETLRAHPPATIVVADLPEAWIAQREEFFRGGRPSGQREILKAIDELKPQYEPAKRIKIPEFEFDILVLQRK